MTLARGIRASQGSLSSYHSITVSLKFSGDIILLKSH